MMRPTTSPSTLALVRRVPSILTAAVVQLAAVLLVPAAFAQDVPAIVAPPAAPLRQLSVTLSPIHLSIPVVELTGELALQPKLSVAGILGYGTVKSESVVVEEVTVLEIGAQVRYYLLGDFEHGLQIGAESIYINASGSGSSGATGIKVSGAGLSLGGFLGYKVVTSMGFTFDAQLGAQRVGIGAEASASTGQTASTSENSVSPLLNLNVGWTF